MLRIKTRYVRTASICVFTSASRELLCCAAQSACGSRSEHVVPARKAQRCVLVINSFRARGRRDVRRLWMSSEYSCSEQ